MSELPIVRLNLSTPLVETLLKSHKDWYHWSLGDNEYHEVLGTIQVIAEHELSDDDGYYEVDTLLVFQIDLPSGQTLHFKKEGTYSSYNGTDWTGAFKHVHPVEKVVYVYE